MFILSLTLKAQNDSLTIPEMPIELKHEKAIRGHVFYIYIAIIEARTRGVSSFDLGQYYGNSLGLTWEPVKDKGLIAYVEWLTAYITLFKDYKLEILHNSKDKLEIRMKDIGEENIYYWSKKYKKDDWLTVEEYFDFFRGFFISTTNYLEFKAESNVEESWLYLKICNN
jgi:hypothetical protein